MPWEGLSSDGQPLLTAYCLLPDALSPFRFILCSELDLSAHLSFHPSIRPSIPLLSKGKASVVMFPSLFAAALSEKAEVVSALSCFKQYHSGLPHTCLGNYSLSTYFLPDESSVALSC